ncbi:MAG: TIM barrel protein [Candidatus Acidiferrum sp.]|jgi:hydroxypyruvate isomerase
MHRRQFLGSAAAAACSAPAMTAAALAAPISALPSVTSEPLGDTTTSSRFPLSVMLWTVHTELSFDQRLEMVAQAGYHAAQLVNEYKNWSKEDFARARRKKESLGITFDATSGINGSICDPARRESTLREIEEHLPVLEELQSTRLILLSGNRVEGLSHAQQHAACVETIKAAADLAAAKNIDLLIENIDPEENPKYFLTSVNEGFDVIREANRPNVKFLYDFFHDQIAEGNLIAKLEKNIDLIGLVHVADVPGRHEPGTGEINYPNIFRKLRALNYRGNIAMEFIPTGDTVSALNAARVLTSSA